MEGVRTTCDLSKDHRSVLAVAQRDMNMVRNMGVAARGLGRTFLLAMAWRSGLVASKARRHLSDQVVHKPAHSIPFPAVSGTVTPEAHKARHHEGKIRPQAPLSRTFSRKVRMDLANSIHCSRMISDLKEIQLTDLRVGNEDISMAGRSHTTRFQPPMSPYDLHHGRGGLLSMMIDELRLILLTAPHSYQSEAIGRHHL